MDNQSSKASSGNGATSMEESSDQVNGNASEAKRSSASSRQQQHHHHRRHQQSATDTTAATMDSSDMSNSSSSSSDGVLSMLRRSENTRENQELAEAKLGNHDMQGNGSVSVSQRPQLHLESRAATAATKDSTEGSCTTPTTTMTQRQGLIASSSISEKECKSTSSSPDYPKPTDLSSVSAELQHTPGAFAVTPTPSICSNISTCSDGMDLDEEQPMQSSSNHYPVPCFSGSPQRHEEVVVEEKPSTTMTTGAMRMTIADDSKRSRQLAVAHLVDGEEEDEEPVLARAQEMTSTDREQHSNSIQHRKKRARNAAVLGMLLFCLVLVAMVTTGILLSSTSKDEATYMGTPPPDPQDTTTATTTSTLDQDILGLLPPDTAHAMEYFPQSPQSRAFDWLLQDPQVHSYSPSRITQRFALATLFFATKGDHWFNNTNWLSYIVHECDWYASYMRLMSAAPQMDTGLLDPYWDTPVCNDEGVYQQLRLYANSLQGSIPKEISLLTNLEIMAAFVNSLTGTLPLQAMAPAIKPLKVLAMAVNQLKGSLPTEVGLISNLAGLGLLYNQLQGSIPSEIGLLRNLVEIHLEENNLTGSLPSELGLLTNASKLHVDSNNITGTIPTELGLLHHRMEDMLLFSNQFSGPLPSELGLLTRLGNLDLSENDLEGTIPVELENLTDLSYWSVSGNPQLSGTFPAAICNKADLELVFDCSQALCGCDNEECPCI